MNDLSAGQEDYLRQHRKHRRIVCISRILILLSFLFIWEFTANVGIIDSFIFSSPSKIALCFWDMTADGSIFIHIGVTLYETLISFLLVIIVPFVQHRRQAQVFKRQKRPGTGGNHHAGKTVGNGRKIFFLFA